MNKEKIKKIIVPILIISAVFLLYLFTELFCGGNCRPFIHGKIPPLQNALLGFVPTLLILLFFRKVAVMWLRHIAWWFTIFTAVIVSNGTGGFLSPSRERTAFLCMALLFIITLVYALIMNKKLKKQGVLTCPF